MAYTVQRGTATITAGNTTTNTTLTTPVPTSSSFVVASMRGTETAQTNFLARAALSDVSGSDYTKITFNREDSTGSCIIDWQVISSPDFAVQSGSGLWTNNSATFDITVSAVDATKTFLVYTASYATAQNDDNGRTAPFSGRFTSTTNIRFEKQLASLDRNATVQWYVVQWTGATVETGSQTIAGGASSNTATITAVDTSKAFVLHSYHQTDATNTSNSSFILVNARFSSTTQLTFERVGTTTDKQIYFFVVSHPDITVQSGAIAITAASASNTATISSVDTTRSFMAYESFAANNKSSDTAGSNLLCYATHTLTNATTVTATTGGTAGTRTAQYFAVQLPAASAAVGTGARSLLTLGVGQ